MRRRALSRASKRGLVGACLASTVLVTGLAAPASAEGSVDLVGAVTGESADSEVVERVRNADGSVTSTVRVGPIVALPHDGQDGDGGHMGGTHTSVVLPFVPPCADCYITGIEPDLPYDNGDRANYDTGVMLHHAVLFDRAREDVTCGDDPFGLAGRRLFASGNERTGGEFPAGNGVKLGQVPLTWGLVELMNMKQEAQAVYLEAEITHVPGNTPGMTELTPVWLDANNCRDSEHSVPEGESTTRWEWESTISGTVKAAGGHVHDGGRMITASNQSTGQTLCASEAGYDTDPSYMGHIESMSTCIGEDLGSIGAGDTVELVSHYHTHHADPAAMSIMMMFVDEQS